MTFKPIAAAALFALAAAAHAASPARPAEFYFDDESGTVRRLPGYQDITGPAMERMLKATRRDPRAFEARAQLAHVAMTAGNVGEGVGLYRALLADMDNSSSAWRSTVWNFGWDLYRAGDAAGALRQFEQLLAAGSRGSWVPPTLSLVLWKLGRQHEARQWYAAAVRTEPALWSDTARFVIQLPDWREEERALLADVHKAWLAKPPRWP